MTDTPRSDVVSASELSAIFATDETVLFVPFGTDIAFVESALPIQSVDHSGSGVTVSVVKPAGDVRAIPIDADARVRVVYP